jgi:hypothetical protein
MKAINAQENVEEVLEWLENKKSDKTANIQYWQQGNTRIVQESVTY